MIVRSGTIIPAEGRATDNIARDIFTELTTLAAAYTDSSTFIIMIETIGLDFGEYMFWWVHDCADDRGFWQTTRECVYDRETDTEWLALTFKRKTDWRSYELV